MAKTIRASKTRFTKLSLMTNEKNNLDETYKKWKRLVNMSASELQKFYNSEEGKEAGLSKSESGKLGIGNGRESARWILKMKNTPKNNWTPKMWEWANRQISFISRMSGNSGSLYDEKGNKTRKHTSLLIWGHNPNKYEQGGNLNNTNKKENKMENLFDRNGNPILKNSGYNVDYHVFDFSEYPQIKHKVNKSETTESVYVYYSNIENEKSATVRFSLHENNAVKFGDQLNGNLASKEEVLFHLGLAQRKFIPGEYLFIHTNQIAKKNIQKYEEADKTIQELYAMGADSDISAYKNKRAKNSNYLILSDKIERQVTERKNAFGQYVQVGKYIYEINNNQNKTQMKLGGNIIGQTGLITDKKSLFKGQNCKVIKEQKRWYVCEVEENGKPKNVYVSKGGIKFEVDSNNIYSVSENQYIPYKSNRGVTYYYVTDEQKRTINKNTGKAYKGKEMSNYKFETKESAQKYADKLNGVQMEKGGDIQKYGRVNRISDKTKAKLLIINSANPLSKQLTAEGFEQFNAIDYTEVKCANFNVLTHNESKKTFVVYPERIYSQLDEETLQADVDYMKSKGIELVESFEQGGNIPNNYEGKTAEQVWDSWDAKQRYHFLSDHTAFIEQMKGIEEIESSELRKTRNADWKKLEKDIKLLISNHVSEGQYAKGGNLTNEKVFEVKYYPPERLKKRGRLKVANRYIIKTTTKEKAIEICKKEEGKDFGQLVSCKATKMNPEAFERGGSIGFIPMDLEEQLAITAKWGGTTIKGVIGFLNAMIDSGLTDKDLIATSTKNTLFQREKSEEKKIQEIWTKIKPKYTGGLEGNMYYSTIKRLIQRANTDDKILAKFKPFRKFQKDSFEEGGNIEVNSDGVEFKRIMRKEGDEKGFEQLPSVKNFSSPKNIDIKAERANVQKFLLEELLGKKIKNEQTGLDVIFTKVGIKKLVHRGGGTKLQILYKIEDIVKDATVFNVEEIKNTNNRLKKDGKFIYNFESHINVDGTLQSFGFSTIFIEKENINIYYAKYNVDEKM